jgi:hypothetical protein
MAFVYHSPNKITLQVIKLLEEFDGIKYEIVYVPIKTESTSIKSECYNNVAKKIQVDGGRIRYGWAIYDNDFFIEAEKHAIWESPTGSLIDVSVSNSKNINQIMFMIDDVNDGVFVPNIRYNYSGLKMIDDYFIMYDILDALVLHYASESTEVKGKFIFPSPLREIARTLIFCIPQFAHHISTYKHSCFCGSEKLYDNCHGISLVEDVINEIDNVILKYKLKKK